MTDKRRSKGPKVIPIVIKIDEDTQAKVGEYNKDEKIFYTPREKSKHFMKKYNAWALDEKVVKYLAVEGARVRLTDKETKWEYEVEAGVFIARGIREEYNDHRSQYFLPLEYWNVVKAKDRTSIVSCGATRCKHNFGGQCFRGVVEISEEGICAGYEGI